MSLARIGARSVAVVLASVCLEACRDDSAGGEMAVKTLPLAAETAGTVLFADDFNRTDGSSLGPRWNITAGEWMTDSRANANRGTTDRASPAGVSCADCRIESRMVGFGTECGFSLREGAGGDRYDLILTTGGRLRIRRWRNGAVAVLGDVASGIPDRGDWATFAFAASGAGPVALTASVNGRQMLAVTDSTAQAITTAGAAGLYATASGTWFDDFTLLGASGGGADGGTATDGGTASDGGAAIDGGTASDGGMPTDGGSGDAGTDAGVGSDGGTGGGGPPFGTVLFADNFNRSDMSGLGANWEIPAGAWITDSRANADRRGFDLAYVKGITCSDCRIDSRLVGFNTELAVVLRASGAAGGDRYDAAITSGGRLRIRRWRGGSATVLGDVASGIRDLGDWASIAFSVSGAAPVTLSATVNGATVLTVTDGSAQAITSAGNAGMTATAAGVWFDDFSLTSLSTGGGADGGMGGTDGGPDAGTDGGFDGGTGGTDGGFDGGTGGTDGGVGGADGGTTGTHLELKSVFSAAYQILAMDGAGTVYGNRVGNSAARLYASSDARAWAPRGSVPGEFRAMAPLSDGTLVADIITSHGDHLFRSADHGRTWTDVLPLGPYRALTTHSFAELDGTAYFVEYQAFTLDAAPIQLWASTDAGRTWTSRFTFQGHRHAHGLGVDRARHALWVWFGDTQSQAGTYRSTDDGRSWSLVYAGQAAGEVDAAVLPDGSILFGQDITYLPKYANAAQLTPDGTLTEFVRLPGPSYSMHALRAGGYAMGVARESGGDNYPAGNTSAYVYTSMDGLNWDAALAYPRRSSDDDVRADVYWELPNGDLLLELRDAQAFSTGTGYKILHPTVR